MKDKADLEGDNKNFENDLKEVFDKPDLVEKDEKEKIGLFKKIIASLMMVVLSCFPSPIKLDPQPPTSITITIRRDEEKIPIGSVKGITPIGRIRTKLLFIKTSIKEKIESLKGILKSKISKLEKDEADLEGDIEVINKKLENDQNGVEAIKQVFEDIADVDKDVKEIKEVLEEMELHLYEELKKQSEKEEYIDHKNEEVLKGCSATLTPAARQESSSPQKR